MLAAGALPIVIGAITPFRSRCLRAYEGRGPITLVQIDAHIDWREDVGGVREGLSSPIRRASEMSHIDKIFQIGIRAQGSARTEEVEAALAYGSNIITAYELHDVGMEAVLARIPDGGNYYLTIDADGMDPAAMPAVAGPAPGGVTSIRPASSSTVSSRRAAWSAWISWRSRRDSTSTASPASRPDA
jgi:agmatinase